MGNLYEFSTDRINIFSLVVDSSSSMGPHTSDMRRGLRMYKDSFKNFPEAESMAISVNLFDGYYHESDFKGINDFDINYSTDGCTAIYYSICQGTEQLLDYINEVTNKTGCIPRATFIVFSDGEPCDDRNTEYDAKEAIKKLNYAGITTVFVAFGNAISSEFGKELGFMSTIDVNDKSVLTTFLGEELSRSCKEQSQSIRALGSNFFSKAIKNSNSEKYSQKTKQALEDDDWFSDI